ncbi:aldehyde dehydrogenase family protein [Paucibacter sp. R3-3]|uniref:Aldehyde dehydrogenase family protein n=1 Tax=Roseateles agri TaxID=3098619 RepID=A0ABU5DRQ5_9BURK|nr:aldehyde dehydrogenase family protein [Paucibacter sp. R3-3]MDY0749006.1 aldehyde dehydrogenase family protein [Paucibacter sp. R3-3]
MNEAPADVNSSALPRPYSFDALYISGHWRSGSAGTILKVHDPYSGSLLAEVPDASLGDIDDAFQGAASAQHAWGESMPAVRADVLRRVAQLMEQRREEIVRWLIQESGSTRIKAEMEWMTVRAIVLESSTLPSRSQGRILTGDFPGKENRIYRKPVGVVTVISPWNWPMHLTARSAFPALALGNAVVVKPANETPITGGLLLAKLLEEAGLPAGVMSVVIGPNETIGDPIVQNPLSRVLSFTGSTAVGRRIGQLAVASGRIKKTMLELGGNAPLVVLDDADLERAVRIATVAKFLHQGQICMATNRIIVMDKLHDAFVESYVDRVRVLKFGDPNDPKTVIGPVISRKQLDRLIAMIDGARRSGARQLLGGSPQGLVLPPQIFDQVTSEMAIAQNEIFGPIAPVIRARDEADALRIANDVESGLSSGVITGDTDRGTRFAHLVEAGMTHVNDVTPIDMPTMPFGGEKNSGLGRFGSEGVIDSFTTEHWISVQNSSNYFPF